MKQATSFDDVSYFKHQFLGDLIITPGVIYYFPHTNVAAAKLERKRRPTEVLFSVTDWLGLPGIALQLAVDSAFDLTMFLKRTFKATTDRTRLKQQGLWRDDESSESLRSRLDAHVEEVRKQASPIVSFEYSLPRPLRFRPADIRNASINLGQLKFDTEYDNHEFRIGFRRQKQLRDALWESGFLGPR